MHTRYIGNGFEARHKHVVVDDFSSDNLYEVYRTTNLIRETFERKASIVPFASAYRTWRWQHSWLPKHITLVVDVKVAKLGLGIERLQLQHNNFTNQAVVQCCLRQSISTKRNRVGCTDDLHLNALPHVAQTPLRSLQHLLRSAVSLQIFYIPPTISALTVADPGYNLHTPQDA